MKNQILDEPIHDSFADFMEKGETILWRGNPRLNKSHFDSILQDIIGHLTGVTIILFILTLHLKDFIGLWGGPVFLIIYLMIQHFWVIYINRKKKNTNYAISQKRIFFSFTNRKTTNIHILEFKELKNFIANQDKFYSKTNTFFLALKNPKSISFTTYNLKNGERRHQPTLELIEDAKAVSKLLKEGIKNINA